MNVQASQSLTFEFTTHSSTGANVNADSTPTGILRINGVSNAASVVVSAISGKTGEYTVSYTVPSTVAINDVVDLVVSSTIGGVAVSAVIWSASVDATVNSRSTYAGSDTTGTTTLLSRISSAITISGGKVAATIAAGDAADLTAGRLAKIDKLAFDASNNILANIAAYGTNLSPAEQVLANTANKLATAGDGSITVGTNNDKTGYAISSTGMTAIAAAVEVAIMNDADGEAVLQAIVNKINSVDPDLGSLTLSAIASACLTQIERAGGMLALVQAQTNKIGTDSGDGAAQQTANSRVATIFGKLPTGNIGDATASSQTSILNAVAGIPTNPLLTNDTRLPLAGNVIAKTGDAMTLTGAYDAAKTAATQTSVTNVSNAVASIPTNPLLTNDARIPSTGVIAKVGDAMALTSTYDAAKTAASQTSVTNVLNAVVSIPTNPLLTTDSRLPVSGTIAKAGDAMTLTIGERAAIATKVELQIMDDTDGEAVLQAIVDKINQVDPDLAGLTISAITTSVLAQIERAGGLVALIKAQSDKIGTTQADSTAAQTTQASVATVLSRIPSTAASQTTMDAANVVLAKLHFDASNNVKAASQTLPNPAPAGYGPGGSSGAISVAIGTTASGSPIGSVSVSLVQGGIPYSFDTDAGGNSTGGLTAGTYQIVVAKDGFQLGTVSVSGGATWNGTNLTISGDCTIALGMQSLTLPPSNSVSDCTVVYTARGNDDLPKDGVVFTLQVKSLPGSETYDSKPWDIVSVGTGVYNTSFTFRRGAQLYVNRGKNGNRIVITIPDAASVDLKDLLNGKLLYGDDPA